MYANKTPQKRIRHGTFSMAEYFPLAGTHDASHNDEDQT